MPDLNATAITSAATATEQARPLSDLEVEVIDLFVSAARLIALPKSVAEIYGLLYISPEPLALEALVNRLRMSKGSASQGLRFLRTIGAITPVYVPGSRCDHFTAVVEMHRLISGFFRGAFQQYVENGGLRIKRIESKWSAASNGSVTFYQDRIAKLGRWYARAQRLLPLTLSIFGKN